MKQCRLIFLKCFVQKVFCFNMLLISLLMCDGVKRALPFVSGLHVAL